MALDESSATLQHWLDRHRAGDPAARNALMGHCRQRLRLLTRQMLRRYPSVHEWEDTSDIVQNVLIRLDRALSAVAIVSVRDFLRLAAAQIRRELIDLKRHYYGPAGPGTNEKTAGLAYQQAMADHPAPDGDDPYQLSLWTEFHGFIAEMEDEDRELFELVYYQGLSQPAAAQLIGMPLTTFKHRWQSARLRLALRLPHGLPGQATNRDGNLDR
jgi:RNA polymerase sigma-70 factor (ECF subfamily)